jgi:hypothetical protein
MSTNTTSRADGISTTRLWLGVAASAGAWFGLGLADMFITWLACVHQEKFGGASAHPGARILYFAFTVLLFGVAALAGTMSYRNWRKLSDIRSLLLAEGYERKEFMALAGLFISVTLGAGIIWLCLPLFILQQCLRAR